MRLTLCSVVQSSSAVKCASSMMILYMYSATLEKFTLIKQIPEYPSIHYHLDHSHEHSRSSSAVMRLHVDS